MPHTAKMVPYAPNMKPKMTASVRMDIDDAPDELKLMKRKK